MSKLKEPEDYQGRMSFENRVTKFWSLVNRGSKDECWLWTGKPRSRNVPYGMFSFNRRQLFAHRFSFLLNRGPIPNGICVLHKCDVPLCVNPGHLFLGTRLDNNRDMWSKGRAQKPPLHAVLNVESVQVIRRVYLTLGKSIRKTAKELNLSVKRVEMAVYRWKLIPW